MNPKIATGSRIQGKLVGPCRLAPPTGEAQIERHDGSEQQCNADDVKDVHQRIDEIGFTQRGYGRRILKRGQCISEKAQLGRSG